MTATTKPTIYELLSKVRESVGSIGKDGFNAHQSFSFRGIDAVMSAFNGPLSEHGVVYIPEVLDSTYTAYTTSSGTGMRNAVLKVKFTFYGPTGDSVAAIVQGEASDSGDKATSKALSMALKYALLHTFCVPTGDEDADGHAHERAAQEPGSWDKGPTCPKCNSALWDNTKDPNLGKRPKWKCKNKACDFASWDDSLEGKSGESGDAEGSTPSNSESAPTEPTTTAGTPAVEVAPQPVEGDSSGREAEGRNPTGDKSPSATTESEVEARTDPPPPLSTEAQERDEKDRLASLIEESVNRRVEVRGVKLTPGKVAAKAIKIASANNLPIPPDFRGFVRAGTLDLLRLVVADLKLEGAQV